MYTNVDNIMNKRNELMNIIGEDNPDVICVTEILPKNSKYAVEIAELQIDEYDLFTNVRGTICHQGVAIYTKKTFTAVPAMQIS